MAPLHAGGLSSQAPPASRTASRTSNSTATYFKDSELPPSPEYEAISPMPRPSPSATMESEGELESETDLPTMTPPSKKQLPLRPRNASPINNTTNKESSVNRNMFVMPPMQRAHSSPGAETNSRVVTPTHNYPRRPPSPLSSGRRRSPLRSAFEDFYPGSAWSSLNIEPNIPEHAELEISTPVTPENEFGNFSTVPTYQNISNTFPRSRRRPTSPLHQSASAPSLHNSAFSSAKYTNEPYPTYGYSFSSTSSMPSTPTSLRSRSPSISSLDTIEDIPDAEEAARLEDEQTKQRTGDDIEVGQESRRRSLDLRTAGLRSNKDRKRWSVCGAERRADFSLEPIEE